MYERQQWRPRQFKVMQTKQDEEWERVEVAKVRRLDRIGRDGGGGGGELEGVCAGVRVCLRLGCPTANLNRRSSVPVKDFEKSTGRRQQIMTRLNFCPGYRGV